MDERFNHGILNLEVQSREKFPMSVECKNQEKVNVWESYKQGLEDNSKDYEPIIVIKRNNSKPLVLVDRIFRFNV